MNSYAEASASVQGDGDSGQAWGMCAARGCCLPGALSTSTQGPKDWWCRVHFGAPAGERDAITAMISNRRELYLTALQLLQPQPLGADTKSLRDRVRSLRPELLKQAHDREAHLGTYILRVLDNECRAPQQHMGVPKSPSQGTTWIDSSLPEEFDT